ncbi:MAG: transposase DNA-binding-containing protein, partial [Betaproteobacteria bacterium]
MEVSLEQEVAGVALGDKRLTDRLAVIVDRTASHPNLSIPAAMHGRSELEAAYRFFANENVTPDAILSTHFQKTKQRIAEHPVCLLIQDT